MLARTTTVMGLIRPTFLTGIHGLLSPVNSLSMHYKSPDRSLGALLPPPVAVSIGCRYTCHLSTPICETSHACLEKFIEIVNLLALRLCSQEQQYRE